MLIGLLNLQKQTLVLQKRVRTSDILFTASSASCSAFSLMKLQPVLLAAMPSWEMEKQRCLYILKIDIKG